MTSITRSMPCSLLTCRPQSLYPPSTPWWAAVPGPACAPTTTAPSSTSSAAGASTSLPSTTASASASPAPCVTTYVRTRSRSSVDRRHTLMRCQGTGTEIIFHISRSTIPIFNFYLFQHVSR